MLSNTEEKSLKLFFSLASAKTQGGRKKEVAYVYMVGLLGVVSLLHDQASYSLSFQLKKKKETTIFQLLALQGVLRRRQLERSMARIGPY